MTRFRVVLLVIIKIRKNSFCIFHIFIERGIGYHVFSLSIKIEFDILAVGGTHYNSRQRYKAIPIVLTEKEVHKPVDNHHYID